MGERTDAVIIGLIVGASVGLGFVNEYRAEKAAAGAALADPPQAVVLRDGELGGGRRDRSWCPATSSSCAWATSCRPTSGCCDVTGLECDESVLTGESMPVEKVPGGGAGRAPRWPS